MKPQAKWTLIVGGILFLGGPFGGVLFTILGMIGAFHTLGDNGISDPTILAHHIGLSLWATMIGMASAAVGLVLIITGAAMYFATKPSPPSLK